MNPQRIQRKRTKGWRMPAGAVYVGRPTLFANPFVMRETRPELWVIVDGDTTFRETFRSKREAAEVAVSLFRSHALLVTGPTSREAIRRTLAGKDLACWCPLDQPCHADVLLEIANKEVPQ